MNLNSGQFGHYVKRVILLMFVFVGIEVTGSILAEFSKLVNSSSLSFYFKQVAIMYFGFPVGASALVILELSPGRFELSKLAPYLRACGYWAVYFPVSVVWAWVGQKLLGAINMPPIISIDYTTLVEHHAGFMILAPVFVILPFIAFDFFYYWFHRLQHKLDFLWLFHSTHHSIRELSSVASYHHVLEELFRIPFIIVPLTLLIKIDAPNLAFISAFTGVWGLFIHMRSPVNLSILNWFIVDNSYHWIHHSILEKHRNKNFSAYFSVWDWIFSTQYIPETGDLPQVGLEDYLQPKSFVSYLIPRRRGSGR